MVAITLAKVSLLIFLYRIFYVDKAFRIVAWITGAILGIWATTATLLAIFACRPVKASWNLSLLMDPKTKCNPKSYNTENVYGFCNVVTDFVLMIMPIPLVWNMQLGFKRKIGLLLIFASGALYVTRLPFPYLQLFKQNQLIQRKSICAVAIVRQYIAYTTGSSSDPSWGIIEIKIWSKHLPFPPTFVVPDR